MTMQGETAAVERVFREEYGRLIASLVRRFGDIDIAEEAAGEALRGRAGEVAGVRRATQPRRLAHHHRGQPRDRPDPPREAARRQAPGGPHDLRRHARRAAPAPVEDDRLRLLFTCCHPALAPEARIALTLRLLGGLTVPEIAQAFLVPESDDGAADHPGEEEDRRGEGALPGARGGRPSRSGSAACWPCCSSSSTRATSPPATATRCAPSSPPRRSGSTRILRQLLPDEPEVAGLLALLMLIEARREARVRNGQLVPLARAGPRRLGPRTDRRGPRPGPRVPRDQPARPLPDTRRDQRRPHRRPHARRTPTGRRSSRSTTS